MIPVGTDGATANNERNTDMGRLDAIFATSSFTPGSILFAGLSGKITSEIGGEIYWDSITNRLGLGTSTPTNQLHISSPGGTQIRLSDTTTAFDTTFRAASNLLDIDLYQTDSPGQVLVRFFRSTTVNRDAYQGVTAIQIFTGENPAVPVLNALIAGVGTDTYFCAVNGSMGIGTPGIDACAKLEVASTTKGLLLTRLATAAVVSPIAGLIFYDNVLNKFRGRTNVGFVDFH